MVEFVIIMVVDPMLEPAGVRVDDSAIPDGAHRASTS
jgi:hypothetical protein